MLNKKRPEVIDALTNFLGTRTNKEFSWNDFCEITGYQGNMFDVDFKIWMNSEYEENKK